MVARYDRVAAAIHWLAAVMMIVVIVLGLFGDPIGKLVGHGAVALHKSLGITVFALTLLRIVWRLGHRAPPLPATTPGWQRAAAHGAHMLLYGFLLAMPLTGYVFGSGGPYPMEWFGVEIPKAPVPKPVAETAHDAHVVGGYAVAVMVVVHIGAACWHQWVQRDNLIARMSLVRRAG